MILRQLIVITIGSNNDLASKQRLIDPPVYA